MCGPACARSARRPGWRPKMQASSFRSCHPSRRREPRACVRGPGPRGKAHPAARAAVARDVVPDELSRLGAQVEVIEAYRTAILEGRRSGPEGFRFRRQARLDHVHQFLNGKQLRRCGGRGSARRCARRLHRSGHHCDGPRSRNRCHRRGLQVHHRRLNRSDHRLLRARDRSLVAHENTAPSGHGSVRRDYQAEPRPRERLLLRAGTLDQSPRPAYCATAI